MEQDPTLPFLFWFYRLYYKSLTQITGHFPKHWATPMWYPDRPCDSFSFFSSKGSYVGEAMRPTQRKYDIQVSTWGLYYPWVKFNSHWGVTSSRTFKSVLEESVMRKQTLILSCGQGWSATHSHLEWKSFLRCLRFNRLQDAKVMQKGKGFLKKSDVRGTKGWNQKAYNKTSLTLSSFW